MQSVSRKPRAAKPGRREARPARYATSPAETWPAWTDRPFHVVTAATSIEIAEEEGGPDGPAR